ncbi:MAG TPA: hypothetical protein VNT51_09940, partial [Miltoncostaeaceae bacterium]|nr:hypothetical protein [Miltoncostaeaceae bacterium]
PREGGDALPPAPRLARELNARTERIVARVAAGYAPEVPTRVPRATEAALRRAVVRFLRVATAALESGRVTASVGRAELAGYRAGLQGAAGLGVALELTRVMAALTTEAEEILGETGGDGDHALPALLAVGDAMQAALLTGYIAAREEARDGRGPAPEDVVDPWGE